MKKKRYDYTGKEKVADLERHFVDRIVSDVYDEYKLNPVVFYLWQKEFFEHGGSAFARTINKKAR